MIDFLQVCKVYPNGVEAVVDVTLHVPPKAVTCLVGTSGCGKTTLLRMVNGLVVPTTGDVQVQGVSVGTQDPIALRRSIGYVIQKGGLMPHMMVLENIALPETIRRMPKETRQAHAEALMDQVGLPPSRFAAQYPDQLSGGQRQRVGLARALMTDPPILLMDEPFGALDPISRCELQDLILEIQQTMRKTILMVTHDMPEAFKLASYIVLLDQGRIVQQGLPQAFLTDPATSFVTQFIDAQRGMMLS